MAIPEWVSAVGVVRVYFGAISFGASATFYNVAKDAAGAILGGQNKWLELMGSLTMLTGVFCCIEMGANINPPAMTKAMRCFLALTAGGFFSGIYSAALRSPPLIQAAYH
jgi:hypothetical protein